MWVDRELSWLVGPREGRSLDRMIAEADVPVRVAVMPHVQFDESRGDPRAIARGIIRRTGRDGLYVLVNQAGRLTLAARNLAPEVVGYRLESAGNETRRDLAGRLGELVQTVEEAPRAPPRDFEPTSYPKGVPSSGGGGNDDPLALVAFGSALFGALAGAALYLVLRAVVGIVRALRGSPRCLVDGPLAAFSALGGELSSFSARSA